MNKLVVNQMATAVGLQIPHYVISTQKKELADFLQAQTMGCITKSISETFFAQVSDGFVVSYTEPVNEADLANYKRGHDACAAAKQVDKKYELRIFIKRHLLFVCHLLANDTQTQVDFRKYNYAKPNRTVPFALPAAVAEKIHLLMQQLKLTTGSIDMLVTQKGEFIFLEVNQWANLVW